MVNPPDLHARDASRQLTVLVNGFGTQLQDLYAVARKALQQDLTLTNQFARLAGIRQTLNQLASQVQAQTRQAIQSSLTIGRSQVERDAEFFSVGIAPALLDEEVVTLATNTLNDETNRQLRLILALLLLGMTMGTNRNLARVFGDSGHVGLLTPSGIVRGLGFWTASLAAQAHDTGLHRIAEQVPGLRRQAVLGPNADHTETCLQVSGQIVGLDENFKLTGQPRYADEMYLPPFHNHCYSRVGIVVLN